jgi:response regulator RpfG family c-di-GMP phosphodiesterase
MNGKPTFEELEQQVKNLEEKVADSKRIINRLLRHNNKRINRNLPEYHQNVQNARMATILALAKLAEYRDDDTGKHLERIREYSRIIAEEMANKPNYIDYITEVYVVDIYHSSILHDIGKVAIPDAILLKPGKLTPDEFEIIKRHSALGGDILTAIEAKIEGQTFLALAKEIAYYHHEKWNGAGYPKGLKGDQIPLSARIVALADVYDALTSERIYKKAITHSEAIKIITNEKGKQFDPDIVDSFLARKDEFKRVYVKLHNEDRYKLCGMLKWYQKGSV